MLARSPLTDPQPAPLSHPSNFPQLFYAGSTGSVYLKEQVGLYKTDGSSLERISGLSRVARLHPAPNNLGLLFAALYNTENAAVYVIVVGGSVHCGTWHTRQCGSLTPCCLPGTLLTAPAPAPSK